MLASIRNGIFMFCFLCCFVLLFGLFFGFIAIDSCDCLEDCFVVSNSSIHIDSQNMDIYSFVVSGNSMNPVLCDGNTIRMVEYDGSFPLDLGYIVLFPDLSAGKGHYISHRIIKLNRTHIVTKGDNNDYIDDAVLVEDISYIVVGIDYT